jgi:hypothetical protein
MAGIGGIQTAVSEVPGVAVEGDFCSLNPRYNSLAGPGGFVAGAAGVTIGRFAWAYPPLDPNGGAQIVLNTGTGLPSGFIANVQQGLNTIYLSDASLFIPGGFGVTLFDDVEVWVKNTGAATAQVGQKCYANFSNGAATFAATASPTGGASGSASTIAATTFSVTASIAGNVMSVTVVGSGTVVPGATISGTNVASGSQVVSQLTPLLAGETAGGVGRYFVSIVEQTVASTTISGTYGLLTVGGTVVTGFAVGQVLTASGSVVAGTTITALGTGTGGAGTYIVNNNTVVSSQAISVAAVNFETNYFARSSGLTGELVKISKKTSS